VLLLLAPGTETRFPDLNDKDGKLKPEFTDAFDAKGKMKPEYAIKEVKQAYGKQLTVLSSFFLKRERAFV
jgi:hypothetical protein